MTARIARSDIPRLAALLTEVGQRLGQHTTRDGHPIPLGEAAWFASLEFQPGSKAARTDAGNGGAPAVVDADPDDERPSYSDPAGEAAASTDRTSQLHARYRALLDWLADNAADLRNLLGELIPGQPNTKIQPCATCGTPRPVTSKRRKDVIDTDVVSAGYCKSCYRDDGYLELIQTDGEGRRYYASLCRWCGAFKAEHGVEPPVALLRIHHQHRRVTVAEVEKHCGHCKKAKKAS